MKVRADVARLLREGLSDRVIADRLDVCARTVAATRAALRMPKHKSGRVPAASVEELFRLRTRPVDGGHLEWTGYRHQGVPALRHAGRNLSACRIAFGIRYDREPEGNVLPGCDFAGICVEPGHMEDRVIRERNRAIYKAIFGEVA
ncbi:helix-turn-helix domain-containing protein [Streptomyces sp. NPDC051320]|uniref:helix-turn-helix domain-containing protein n=1 Tax=Streptomyces sp. NPDC051320 TaxID=3154644 RepID=UPI003434B9C7